jgi:hypothetical protein
VDQAKCSFFSRVARFEPGLGHTPRENSLTEAFVAVLEHCSPDPASALIEELTAWSADDWSAKTQVSTGRGLDKIDIELLAESALLHDGAVGKVRVWIEVKHHADLGHEQLKRYRQALDAQPDGREGRLLLLAPLGFPRNQPAVKDHVHDVVDWQAVGSCLKTREDHESLSEHGRWLVREFLSFLREEGLAVTEALTPRHVDAVLLREHSFNAFQGLLRIAFEQVKQAEGEPDPPWPPNWPEVSGSPQGWPSFHVYWPESRASSFKEQSGLEWNLYRWAWNSGQLVFGAGLTVHGASLEQSESLLEDRGLLDLADFSLQYEKGVARFYRWKAPEAMIGSGHSLGEQAASLANWVSDTFAQLRQASAKLR